MTMKHGMAMLMIGGLVWTVAAEAGPAQQPKRIKRMIVDEMPIEGDGEKVPAPKKTEKEPPMTQELKMTKTDSGLMYADQVVGKGDSPVKGAKVTVHYTGTLTNGKKFDSSVDRNEPFVFTIGIGQVIKGWDEGVMSMKVGGKRTLSIPPSLGYGSHDVGNGLIPANSTLKFDVELLKVELPKK